MLLKSIRSNHTKRTETTTHIAKPTAKEPLEQLFRRDLLLEHRTPSTRRPGESTTTKTAERRSARGTSTRGEPAVRIASKPIILGFLLRVRQDLKGARNHCKPE